MRVLDLFSGLGGFSLGLEATGGFETVAFCEISDFPKAVLSEHWPGVPIYDDVRKLGADRLAADGIAVDVITGGFPCQDISLAGSGDGLDGERSRLWYELARLVGEIRPRYVVMENSSALLVRGIERVLGGLAAIGYDAEWHCIQAADVGAPHFRDRIWIVAYPDADGGGFEGEREPQHSILESAFRDVPDGLVATGRRSGEDAPDALGVELRDKPGRRGWARGPGATIARDDGSSWDAPDAAVPRLEVVLEGVEGQFASAVGAHAWSSGSPVRGVAHGVPDRVDRIKALGNAVVPPIPFAIGKAILATEGLGA